jgi:6,7-dimethyl-8-ribityllumazine synthase
MLQKTIRKTSRVQSARITIVASAYNSEYVDGMIDAAVNVLAEGGVENVELIRVPGAFEIPVIAAKTARRKRKRPQVVLNLGVIFRGKTAHAEYIGNSITQSLASIATETEVPMIHEVLLLENKSQAKSRCLSRETNRGAEAAHTALAMAELFRQIS